MMPTERHSKMQTIRHRLEAIDKNIKHLSKMIDRPSQFKSESAALRAIRTIDNLKTEKTRLKRQHRRLRDHA